VLVVIIYNSPRGRTPVGSSLLSFLKQLDLHPFSESQALRSWIPKQPVIFVQLLVFVLNVQKVFLWFSRHMPGVGFMRHSVRERKWVIV